MMFYSRSKNKEGKMERVADHLRAVAELAKTFADAFGCGTMGEWVGLLHDFGKYSEKFQKVLLHEEYFIDHASPGAALAEEKFVKRQDICCHLISVIMAHHGSLRIYVGSIKRRLYGGEFVADKTPSLQSAEALMAAYKVFKAEINTPREKCNLPTLYDDDAFLHGIKHMLFDRMLLSSLVDADYSSAACHDQPDYLNFATGPPLDAFVALERLKARREEIIVESTASNALNQIREQLYHDCLNAGKQAPGLFTLTAPTGTGKTLSMMAFALSHAIAHREDHPKRRIFVVLPYLSIIQQNTEEYRRLVPDLLELHSQAALTEDTRLLADRCSAPLVVTTSVHFFEALFAAKAQRCRWLHEIAGSIILFDEAQSLPPKVARATLETLKVLCEQYGCTVVFSTATQPAFDHRIDMQWKPREIVANHTAMFNSTRRVRVEWSISKRVEFAEIADKMAKHPQALAIVNIRRHARELYQCMTALGFDAELFFMSSDMCAAHRKDTLKVINRRLKEGLPCKLVATQCVEAGVDFSFPVVYRSLAPLESIIQAAGRCNRNGSDMNGSCIVFLPEDGKRPDCELYPDKFYQLSANKVLDLHRRHEIDINNPQHIDEYYQLLYSETAADSKKLCEAIKNFSFDEVERQYKLIDEHGFQVVTMYDPTLFEEIRAQALSEGFTPALAAKARGITVSCTKREEVKTYCEPIPYRKRGRGKEAETGWYLLATPKAYDSKTGLWFDDSLTMQMNLQ